MKPVKSKTNVKKDGSRTLKVLKFKSYPVYTVYCICSRSSFNHLHRNDAASGAFGVKNLAERYLDM